MKRPNIIFFMADQHNSNSMGCAGHPNVKTPALDWIAQNGVRFTNAYCNNPICAPSRLSFVSGQYPHTHRFLGNNNFDANDSNPNTIGALLRRYGYQTAQIGKAHMIKKWDEEAYEHIRYCDLCDADRNDPTTNHYFRYLVDHGVADMYEDGALPSSHEYNKKQSAIAALPYKHSNEHWTGQESLDFLKKRDQGRPFFLHMSFERPHPNWMPAAEHANLYNPDEIQLAEDYIDWWERQWQGRPAFITDFMKGAMAKFENQEALKKALASHFALVTVIDSEIGKIIDFLSEIDELDNTVIVYSADHGDFAGDHGVINKNIGIYESIHKIPFLVKYPNSPSNITSNAIIESVDLLPTICELANVPIPEGIDGCSIIPAVEGKSNGKQFAICEWDFPEPQRRVNAIRTQRYRLVYYSHSLGGELYDHERDPYELYNLWDNPEYQKVRMELQELLFDQVNMYARKSDFDGDALKSVKERYSPTSLIHQQCAKWSKISRN